MFECPSCAKRGTRALPGLRVETSAGADVELTTTSDHGTKVKKYYSTLGEARLET